MTLEDVLLVMHSLFRNRDYTVEEALDNFQAITDEAQNYMNTLVNTLKNEMDD